MDSILSAIFVNQWVVVIIVTLMLIVFSEVGFRFGLRLYRAKDEPRKAQIGSVQGAILALLGLLLGFTFSMAVGRYDSRRDLVLQEANSIGTTFLRASFLPETHRLAVEDLLRHYVEVRIDFYGAGSHPEEIATAERKTSELQKELWTHTVAAGKEQPNPLTASFVTSLNETIDLDAIRLNALRAKVPGAVWLLVLIVASAGCFACGYANGSSGARSGFANLMLPLLIAVVVTLIADFDRPRHGLIDINQQPMMDLKESLRTNPL